MDLFGFSSGKSERSMKNGVISMRSIFFTLAGMAMVWTTSTASAQTTSSDEIAALRAQIEYLLERVEALEESVSGSAVIQERLVARRTEQQASWTDIVEVSGDLRYRHETINDELFTDRHRQRIRARLGVNAQPADNLQVGFGLTTGGANPISGNQTLDGGFSSKDVAIDYAYFDWGLTDTLDLRGGKMRNPFFRPASHHLINDSDLNPEGLALRYASGDFFANAGGFYVEERSASDETTLIGAQAGFARDLPNGVRVTAGASYFAYDEAKGRPPFFFVHGNQLDANGNYLNDFNLTELFGQLDFDAGGHPVRVFVDLVTNTEVDRFGDGYAFGIFYGDASDPGTWDVGYTYQDLEADAVVGTFSDSDWAGGGTDAKGHTFTASYVMRDSWNFGFRYILTERGEAANLLRDYNRLMMDVSFSY
jgi:hypothetical protein